MLGISYGELFLIIGATAALIGPKDLPVIARAAGRLAGRAIGYVQVARGQFASIMQQSQVSQVHKELQDTMAQLEAIRYEIRGITIMNPIPFTRTFDGIQPPANNGLHHVEKSDRDYKPVLSAARDSNSADVLSSVYSQATMYARLAETPAIKYSSPSSVANVEQCSVGHGLASVLPISAESAGLLPKISDDVKGSDIVLEAIIEAEVAQNAKTFLSQPENQMPNQ